MKQGFILSAIPEMPTELEIQQRIRDTTRDYRIYL